VDAAPLLAPELTGSREAKGPASREE
jgi:hypothetical protein